MNLIRRTKARISKTPKVPLVASSDADSIWALDFMYDALRCVRSFRTLSVIDESNRETLALEEFEEIYDLPKSIQIHLGNGSKLRFTAFMGWCAKNGIALQFILPGKPQ